MIPRLLAIPLALGSHALAQCSPQWSGYSGPYPDGPVLALTSWDPDGAGPAPPVVVAGGYFQHIGSLAANFVGVWNGSSWAMMGAGVNGGVKCALTFDADGPGPSPPQPVIGGYFQDSGAQSVFRVARFDGISWLPFGPGVGGSGVASVDAMSLLGPNLIVGGQFFSAGGLPVEGLARWDGTAWHAFSDQRAGGPSVLATLAGTLFGGGSWAGATVLRLDDPSWTVVGQNWPDGNCHALTSYRGELIAAGWFITGQFVYAYDGSSWHTLGTGPNSNVNALTVFDPDGPGPMPDLLIAGGSFSTAGGQPASCIAAWDGANWSPLGAGTNSSVLALTVWNNQLVVGGAFGTAGGLTSPAIAVYGCPQPVPCYPNCDASTAPPALNINDFTCFLNAFAAASPYANCDNSTLSPTLNVIDFICFLNQFAAGCS